MFQKLTASLLFGLMMMVTATSQGAVYYCLCQNTITVGHCGCDEVDAAEQGAKCHCCEEEADPEIAAEAVHRHDCTIAFLIDVDDYGLSSDPVSTSREDESDQVFLSSRDREGNALWQHLDPTHGVKGPPDRSSIPGVSLYLRNLVFLV